MGIVAYCPQGHRVKVKDQLACRKGICPECGSRFRIPYESQPEPQPLERAANPSVAEVATPAAAPAASSALPIARIVSFDAELAATLPRALPLAAPADGQTEG